MIRRCIICGAEFSTPPSNNRRTCSPACSSQWRSKQHMGVSNRWSEGVKAAARAAAAKTGNLKNGTAAAMNLPERISIHAPLAGCDSKNAQKLLRIFAATDKTQDISDRTLPVKVFRPMRSMMETVRFRCEPPHKTMYAHNSHYTISGSSGK